MHRLVPPRGPAPRPLDGLEDLLDAAVFPDVAGDPYFEGSLQVLELVRAGEHDDLGARMLPDDVPRGIEAVPVRKAQVQQQDVRVVQAN